MESCTQICRTQSRHNSLRHRSRSSKLTLRLIRTRSGISSFGFSPEPLSPASRFATLGRAHSGRSSRGWPGSSIGSHPAHCSGSSTREASALKMKTSEITSSPIDRSVRSSFASSFRGNAIHSHFHLCRLTSSTLSITNTPTSIHQVRSTTAGWSTETAIRVVGRRPPRMAACRAFLHEASDEGPFGGNIVTD